MQLRPKECLAISSKPVQTTKWDTVSKKINNNNKIKYQIACVLNICMCILNNIRGIVDNSISRVQDGKRETQALQVVL